MSGHDPHAVVPPGHLKDSAGRLVPLHLVKAEHMLEDTLVRDLHQRGAAASAELSAFKGYAFGEIAALLQVLLAKHGVERGGQKGNLTLETYNGALRVTVAIGEQISFGPELQAAKHLVDACLEDWAQGADPKLKALIDDAFDVGKEGKLRVDRILALRRMNIDDERWKRAMEAIGEAIRVVSTKRYIRLHKRNPVTGELEQLQLDIARVAE